MKVINTNKSDLDFIYKMFDDAIEYQRNNNFPAWPDYDKDTLKSDIRNKLQYKILINDTIACIFSICYSDKIVWRERDKNPAIYLHRIVVNKNFKGLKLFGAVLEWAKKKASKMKLNNIRMDTWADNSSIIDYYHSFGFETVEYYRTPDSKELPIQQRDNEIVLLQYKND